MPKRNNKAYGAPRAPVAQRHGPVGAAVILDTESSKLLLSGESFASNREKLQAAGDTAIVACGCRCHFVDTFTYLDVRLKDDSHAKAGRHLDPAADFIALHLAKGGTVLCHCKAGICRSTTMVMAYLIKYRGLGVDEALAAVRQARRCANPRGEIMAALHSFAQRASWLQGQETSEAPVVAAARLLEVARCREGDEFLSYFPRLRPLYDEVAADLRRLSLTGGAEWVRDAPIGEVEAAIEAARRLPPPEETAGAALHAVAGQPLLLTLVGLPGSGKTTLCGQLGEAVGRRLRHVSQDECGTRRLCIEAATEALRAGRSVIIDRCNADPAQRELWVALGREHGCVVASVHLDLPVEECLRRVIVRRRHPTLPAGERAAAVVHKFASELSRPAPSEGFDAALVATTVDEARELVGTLTQAIICATSMAGVAGDEEEGNGGVSPDLTLAERRKHKAAVAKLRRSRRDIKLAATSHM